MTYVYAKGGLMKYEDIILAAFASDSDKKLVEHFRKNKACRNVALLPAQELWKKIREKMDVFVTCFFCGISCYGGTSSCLRNLDCGGETLVAIRKQIAEYVGVLTNEEVTKFQKAYYKLWLACFFILDEE